MILSSYPDPSFRLYRVISLIAPQLAVGRNPGREPGTPGTSWTPATSAQGRPPSVTAAASLPARTRVTRAPWSTLLSVISALGGSFNPVIEQWDPWDRLIGGFSWHWSWRAPEQTWNETAGNLFYRCSEVSACGFRWTVHCLRLIREIWLREIWI